MEENQNTEWKESWHDEYLEWICGYANAYGGRLYIGKDDKGNVVGVQKSKKLMELIPSKITDKMGIVADVNLLHKGELEYIKVGHFGESDSDLQYQDEVHGPLIEQADKAVELVYTKYLKALVAYEGIQRTEQYMFHKEAFREILLNAIVHKAYRSCNPIQISVYSDKIYVWNDGEMPASLASTEKLFQKHSSKPYNPKLANIFFKSGMIEAWGRGFDKIREACRKYNAPLPEYEINEEGIMVYCKACDKYLKLLHQKNQAVQIEQDNEQDLIANIIRFCVVPKSSNEIIAHFNMPNRSYFKRHFLDKMLKAGMLKMTIPEKPSSKKQKYFS